MLTIKDEHNRSFKKLRISLLSQCNFSCNYCVAPSNNHDRAGSYQVTNGQELSGKRLFHIVRAIHSINPLEEVKLTGGEPLLYNGIIDLAESLHHLEISKLSLTTNGQFLKPLAEDLFHAGIRSINVSLDAVDAVLFRRITKKDVFHKVLDGISAARKAGITVKINAVIMRGMNDNQIIPLLEFARDNGLVIRFLELMKMGHLFQDYKGLFFPEQEILKEISGKYGISPAKRKAHSTANYWQLEDGYRFGIIANESSPFCGDCDRLRLDSRGRIFGCICSVKGIDVSSVLENESEVIERLRLALGQKQSLKFRGSPVSMKQIGG